MKVTARSPATANVAPKPGVVLVAVAVVVLVGFEAGVEIVVVVVDSVVSWLRSEPVSVVAVDLAASGLYFLRIMGYPTQA